MRRTTRFLFLVVLAFGGCLHQNRETIPGPETPGDESGPDSVAPALSVITGLAGPESALYDPDQDVYFISNLNGGLLAQDNNGFISRVQAGTMAMEPKWIAGGTNGVRLDAPKGMAILGDSLYVSDVTAVRKFDRRSGAPRGEIPLPGATLINDLTTDGTSVYVSDTAVKPSAGITFAATGTDAIWKITGDRAAKIASGAHLNQPNGLEFAAGQLWVASFRGNELYRLEGDQKQDVRHLPRGQLDGLVLLPGGTRLVTSWIGNAVYRESSRGRFVAILRGIAAPADIGYDGKRKRLLVPSSTRNQVTVHAVR